MTLYCNFISDTKISKRKIIIINLLFQNKKPNDILIENRFSCFKTRSTKNKNPKNEKLEQNF